MARILQAIRARMCVIVRDMVEKVIYILYTKYTKLRIYTLKQKSCPRQLSRVIAMDSTRTKLENKILRVLIFISSWQYTRNL